MSAESRPAKRRLPPHEWLARGMHLLVGLGVLGALYERQWLNAVLVAGILLITLLPSFLQRRLRFDVPAEFELATIAFLFASLFLGEMRGYYARFWWWDMVLHAGSGFLLGVVGFLLVYALNETPAVDLHMRPRFVALFAFTFAMAIGALWEIFEFAMDQIFGMNMQKSGVVDTMWDLIVDAVGSGTVALYGWYHLHRSGKSFLERWIDEFVERNPSLFRR